MSGLNLENLKRCFKAYDVRGKVPVELNADAAYRIGQAYARFIKAKRVAVGCDARLTSPELSEALIAGLNSEGVEVIWLGLCGTEHVYFATFHGQLDGGIMVTASHNPADYNGLKFVREDAKPISADTGLQEIFALIASGRLPDRTTPPRRVQDKDIFDDYIEHILKFIDPQDIKPFKIVANVGNGVAGKTLALLTKRLPCKFTTLLPEADGKFPNGVPNPLLPENQGFTAAAVRRENADLGIAWDGDFDRCFFFDEKGEFVDGYYALGLMIAHLLDRYYGARIVHDPRLIWNTLETIEQNSGIAVMNKSGHSFMKARMREEEAAFGGETSAHYYFKDFGYCDSGMIPWLVMLEIMSKSGQTLSQLVAARKAAYPISGEINTQVADPQAAIEKVRKAYEKEVLTIDETDGLSMEFKTWRFNLRMSNTEPLVRLNIETRGDVALVKAKVDEVLAKLR